MSFIVFCLQEKHKVFSTHFLHMPEHDVHITERISEQKESDLILSHYFKSILKI